MVPTWNYPNPPWTYTKINLPYFTQDLGAKIGNEYVTLSVAIFTAQLNSGPYLLIWCAIDTQLYNSHFVGGVGFL